MCRKQKNRSGDRITGSLDPFLVEELQKVHIGINSTGSIVVENLLELFRENSKIVVALRMRQAVDMNRPISAITAKSRDIISNYLNTHEHAADTGYVNCTLRYFSGEKKHSISLNLGCASCRSKDPDKALTHARRDCEKYRKVYIGHILRKLKEKPWSNLSEEQIKDLYIQYQSIEYSIKFVCAYLTKLCNGKLPKSLGEDVFSEACMYDHSLADHYNHNSGLEVYILNTKRNHSFSTVNQECATYVFCATY